MEMIAFKMLMSLAIGFVAGRVWRAGRRQDEIEAKLDAVKLILERVSALLDGPEEESSSASSEGDEL